MVSTFAEAEEELIDLEDDIAAKKKRIADPELGKAMGRDGVMQDISDDPEIDTLYSMVDGMPIQIPHFMTARTLRKRLPTGVRAFTSDKRKAPRYRINDVLCWLHRDHERREEWDSMGLAGLYCEAAHLASPYSARIHMQHRHKQEYGAISDYLSEQETTTYRENARLQLEATLALAGRAAELPTGAVRVAPIVAETCACGYVTPEGKNPKASLAMHKRLHCPLREDA